MDRLIDGGDREVRALLRSAEGDAPSKAARAATLAGLGLAATSVAMTSTVLKTLSTAKVLTIGAASTLIFAGAVQFFAAPPEPTKEITVVETVVEPAPMQTMAPPPVIVTPAQSASVVAPLPRAKPAPKPSALSITDELAIMDRAQAALREKKSRDAIAALDEHDAKYPSGAFGQESEVLRIEALVQAGQKDAAKKRGHVFLQAHPNAPQAARVRSLIGE